MASLLPDPMDENWTMDNMRPLGQILKEFFDPMNIVGLVDIDSRHTIQTNMLTFISQFSNYDNSVSPRYLQCARKLVSESHPANTSEEKWLTRIGDHMCLLAMTRLTSLCCAVNSAKSQNHKRFL